MKITIWSDLVCPFCFIGQAHLHKALESFDHREKVEIEYNSFILSPEAQYVPDQDYYNVFAEMKGISREESKTMLQGVMDMGQASGVDINYNVVKNANTKDAHRVLQYAKELGKDSEYFERLYKAHFSEGQVISDRETIIRLAGDVGIDSTKVAKILDSNEYDENVNQDVYESRLAGVSSVPFFVFDNKYSVSGAQPVELFSEILDKVWEEEM